MSAFLKKLAPPGYPIDSALIPYCIGAVAAWVYSLFFFLRFNNALDALYEWDGEKNVLRPDAVMPDFATLYEDCMDGFLFLALLSLCMSLAFYVYYSTRGSHALYLMRRLPDKTALLRQCITLPILAALAALLAAALLTLVYFALYHLITPDAYLTGDQGYKLWRYILSCWN